MQRRSLEDIKVLASKHGGECLSTTYRNIRSPSLLWRCAQGHEFEATGWNVLRGGWCPTCRVPRRGLQAETLARFIEIALPILLRGEPHVKAARALGVSAPRFRKILRSDPMFATFRLKGPGRPLGR